MVVAPVLVLVVVVVVCKWFLSVPVAAPRYVVLGPDERQSVMRLVDTDVSIARLADDRDDDERRRYRHAASADAVGVFVVRQPATSSAETGNSLRCRSSYRYQIFVVSSASEFSDGDDDLGQQLRRSCVRAGAVVKRFFVFLFIIR